jgi:hypothetical protein
MTILVTKCTARGRSAPALISAASFEIATRPVALPKSGVLGAIFGREGGHVVVTAVVL